MSISNLPSFKSKITFISINPFSSIIKKSNHPIFSNNINIGLKRNYIIINNNHSWNNNVKYNVLSNSYNKKRFPLRMKFHSGIFIYIFIINCFMKYYFIFYYKLFFI